MIKMVRVAGNGFRGWATSSAGPRAIVYKWDHKPSGLVQIGNGAPDKYPTFPTKLTNMELPTKDIQCVMTMLRVFRIVETP